MKRILLLPIALAILLGCARPLTAAEVSTTANTPSAKPATPGVELAEAISTITGVAISPLLGVSAVGAWKYHEATPAARANLPWFAQPWFWMPGFLVVGICALKDVFGLSVPAALKKPFDVIETMAHKISGLVVAGAFVPLIASVFKTAGAAAPAGLNAGLAGHGFLAAINSSWLLNGLSVTALLFLFFIVFLASNAINILILLSPFPIVDAGLKLFRLTVLSTVVATSLANPWLGALWSLVIFIIAYFIAGWSFRLSHFGMVFIWDFSTRRSARFNPDQTANWMFLGRAANQVPIRTYGTFTRHTAGEFVFHYRPWLVLAPRILTFPPGNYAVGQGLFYSEIVRIEGHSLRSVMLLPPRYRSHEAELAAHYGLTGVREAGLRAAYAWLKEWLGLRPKPQLLAA